MRSKGFVNHNNEKVEQGKGEEEQIEAQQDQPKTYRNDAKEDDGLEQGSVGNTICNPHIERDNRNRKQPLNDEKPGESRYAQLLQKGRLNDTRPPGPTKHKDETSYVQEYYQ